MWIIYLIVSLFSSVIGAISGIGGGIIIKPVLDAVSSYGASTISFLSGTTVLSMAGVSLLFSLKQRLKMQTGICALLAAGGIAGGFLGKYLFDLLKSASSRDSQILSVQSALLIAVTAIVLLFVLFKRRIKTLHVKSPVFCLFIGLLQGLVSAFLGIGGGPLNIAVLNYFFSMDTKTAARNSLYIIFFSQLASFSFTIASGTISQVNPFMLAAMIPGAVVGGLLGSFIAKKMNGRQVDVFFICLLSAIVLLNCINLARFTGIL